MLGADEDPSPGDLAGSGKDLKNSNDNHRLRPFPWDLETKSRLECSSATFLQRLFYKSRRNPLETETSRERSRQLLIFMHDSWLRQVMCDVRLNCSDGTLMAHQGVISAYSPTLSSILTRCSILRTATVNLCQVPRRIAADVLNFLYTTDLRLNCRVIEQVILCARQLDLPLVLDVCEDYLIQCADADNVLLHFSVAHNTCLEETKDRLLSVIAQSFEEVYVHPHYPLLTREKLLEIFRHPNLSATERDLFVGTLKWVDHARDERFPVAHEILKRVDLGNIELHEMTQLLDEYDWIMGDHGCNKLIVNVYRHHAISNSRKIRAETETRQESNLLAPGNKPSTSRSADQSVSILRGSFREVSTLKTASVEVVNDDDATNETESKSRSVKSRASKLGSQEAEGMKTPQSEANVSYPNKEFVKVNESIFSEKIGSTLEHRVESKVVFVEDGNADPYPERKDTSDIAS